jgi:opacity protein-like surface antigen
MKSTVRIALAAFAIACLASPALAGPRLGGAVGLGTANDNVDNGLVLQGYLELDVLKTALKRNNPFNRDLTLRGGLSYLTGDTTGETLRDGELTMLGIEAAALYRVNIDQATSYLGAGIGYYTPEHTFDKTTKTKLVLRNLEADDDLDSGIGFFLTGGIRVPMSDTVSIGASARYLFLEVDDHATKSDLNLSGSISSTKKIDLGTLFLSASLQIQF